MAMGFVRLKAISVGRHHDLKAKKTANSFVGWMKVVHMFHSKEDNLVHDIILWCAI